ncbi:MAG: GAF domain-containing protein [Okeania sp. SIO2D1]|nr:GAF domain-containing protein [Okeania sp. SIO2D1]
MSGVRSQESGVNPPLAPPRRGRKEKKRKYWRRVNFSIYTVFFGNTSQIFDYIFMLEKYLYAGLEQLIFRQNNFYNSLVRLAVFHTISEEEQAEFLEKVMENQKQMKVWAERAPMNVLHQYQLVEAERCRVMDCKLEAIDLYDRAIALAQENNYVQEEALANELAAKFYLNWGKEKIAAGYMQEAYYCYAKWGVNEVRSQKSEVRSYFCNGDLSPAPKILRLKRRGFRPMLF